MEGLEGIITSLGAPLGFLAFCVAMIWKVVSDKKENTKTKDIAEKTAQILEYITKEKEDNKTRQSEMQRQIAENTEAIGKISAILEKLSAKLNQRPKPKKTTSKIKEQ